MSRFKQFSSALLTGVIIVPGAYLLSLRVLAEDNFVLEEQLPSLHIVEQTTLLAVSTLPQPKVVKTIKVIVTGYSSTVSQTDSTPFITASGQLVRDGIVANNMLSFGSKIKLPEIFGDKLFTVTDRMHQRKGDYHVDIWFSTKKEALEFGAVITEMEILQ